MHKHDDAETAPAIVADELVDEKAKIRGAVRTDFILSAEIIIIALGVVAHMGMAQKAMVMSAIGIGMTVLVYGLVAGIVKLDDIGNWLQGKSSAAARHVGRGLIVLMPWFMRGLAVVGMLAMFLVGGGIIVHGLAPVSEFLHAHHWESGLPGMLASLVVGLATGAAVCAVVLPLMKWFGRRQGAH